MVNVQKWCGWLVFLFGAVAAPTVAQRPDILVVTVDTLRADHLGAYGYDRPTSPTIDGLLARGAAFSSARTVEPLTAPSLVTMFTSLPPHEHGASRNGLRMRGGLESLPKLLGRVGYRTAGVISNWTLKDNLTGLGAHFGEFQEVFTRKRWFGLVNGEADGTDVTRAAVEWAEGHRRREPSDPFLLWVHYSEPHAPYRLQSDFRERLGLPRDPGKIDRYDSEIAFVDREIGRLLTEVGSDRPVLVVFASDHGESLGERGYWGHGRHLYESTLHVPLGLLWEGRLEPRVVAAPATLADVAPTVLGLLGLPAPEAFVGHDWTPTLTGGIAPDLERVTCHQAHRGAVQVKHESEKARTNGLLEVGLATATRKEILEVRTGSRQSFDLTADPDERKSVATGAPSPELLACLGAVVSGLEAADELRTVPLDPTSEEHLRALGYLD